MVKSLRSLFWLHHGHIIGSQLSITFARFQLNPCSCNSGQSMGIFELAHMIILFIKSAILLYEPKGKRKPVKTGNHRFLALKHYLAEDCKIR